MRKTLLHCYLLCDNKALMTIIFYRYADHEVKVGDIAKEFGFKQVSLSHQVMPMTKIVPRGFTASADAYLTPHIKNYLQVQTKNDKE